MRRRPESLARNLKYRNREVPLDSSDSTKSSGDIAARIADPSDSSTVVERPALGPAAVSADLSGEDLLIVPISDSYDREEVAFNKSYSDLKRWNKRVRPVPVESYEASSSDDAIGNALVSLPERSSSDSQQAGNALTPKPDEALDENANLRAVRESELEVPTHGRSSNGGAVIMGPPSAPLRTAATAGEPIRAILNSTFLDTVPNDNRVLFNTSLSSVSRKSSASSNKSSKEDPMTDSIPAECGVPLVSGRGSSGGGSCWVTVAEASATPPVPSAETDAGPWLPMVAEEGSARFSRETVPRKNSQSVSPDKEGKAPSGDVDDEQRPSCDLHRAEGVYRQLHQSKPSETGRSHEIRNDVVDMSLCSWDDTPGSKGFELQPPTQRDTMKQASNSSSRVAPLNGLDNLRPSSPVREDVVTHGPVASSGFNINESCVSQSSSSGISETKEKKSNRGNGPDTSKKKKNRRRKRDWTLPSRKPKPKPKRKEVTETNSVGVRPEPEEVEMEPGDVRPEVEDVEQPGVEIVKPRQSWSNRVPFQDVPDPPATNSTMEVESVRGMNVGKPLQAEKLGQRELINASSRSRMEVPAVLPAAATAAATDGTDEAAVAPSVALDRRRSSDSRGGQAFQTCNRSSGRGASGNRSSKAAERSASSAARPDESFSRKASGNEFSKRDERDVPAQPASVESDARKGNGLLREKNAEVKRTKASVGKKPPQKAIKNRKNVRSPRGRKEIGQQGAELEDGHSSRDHSVLRNQSYDVRNEMAYPLAKARRTRSLYPTASSVPSDSETVDEPLQFLKRKIKRKTCPPDDMALVEPFDDGSGKPDSPEDLERRSGKLAPSPSGTEVAPSSPEKRLRDQPSPEQVAKKTRKDGPEVLDAKPDEPRDGLDTTVEQEIAEEGLSPVREEEEEVAVEKEKSSIQAVSRVKKVTSAVEEGVDDNDVDGEGNLVIDEDSPSTAPAPVSATPSRRRDIAATAGRNPRPSRSSEKRSICFGDLTDFARSGERGRRRHRRNSTELEAGEESSGVPSLSFRGVDLTDDTYRPPASTLGTSRSSSSSASATVTGASTVETTEQVDSEADELTEPSALDLTRRVEYIRAHCPKELIGTHVFLPDTEHPGLRRSKRIRIKRPVGFVAPVVRVTRDDRTGVIQRVEKAPSPPPPRPRKKRRIASAQREVQRVNALLDENLAGGRRPDVDPGVLWPSEDPQPPDPETAVDLETGRFLLVGTPTHALHCVKGRDDTFRICPTIIRKDCDGVVSYMTGNMYLKPRITTNTFRVSAEESHLLVKAYGSPVVHLLNLNGDGDVTTVLSRKMELGDTVVVAPGLRYRIENGGSCNAVINFTMIPHRDPKPSNDKSASEDRPSP